MNLEQKYDRDVFLEFLNSFLPNFAKDIRPARVDGQKVVEEIVYLGESKELDLSVFELTHSSTTDARIALATAGFKVMKVSAVYRALIIYRAGNSDDWRLSLMTAIPGVNQKGKIGQTLSNPRRFSFFLGPNAKINTPHKFLIKQGVVKDFTDLQQRFSLEVVNKEFYKKIQEAYYELVGGTLGEGGRARTYPPLLYLPSQPDHSQVCLEFAVRLIGRIIFCWFLREKKSPEGISLMPKGLLSLGAISEHSNYYHKILEPIFFEVLNKVAQHRKELYSHEDFATVPYLNGGLFSPHTDDYHGQYNLVVPDKWLTELFAVLEIYNFTIDENTSFDEELSIDPEMLGRIFENLLAEINPETGESARKSTGSYYTPRTIVDYMVDESLFLYLQQKTGISEEKLRAIISYDLSDDIQYKSDSGDSQKIIGAISKIKIIDPACGSGAFPIGALQKIVFILQQIDPQGKMWFEKQINDVPIELQDVIRREFQQKNFDYIRKLGIIRENIFGVDIQPIATEISRLRCFLTLIVDQSVDDTLENRGIVQLPNLDFKFVTANSLIDLPDIDDVNQADMFDDRNNIDRLKSLRDRYFTATGGERLRLMAEFSNLQAKMSKELIKEYGSTSPVKLEFTSKLADWKPFTHKPASWFNAEWMFGVKGGFDVVIANPPYIGEKGHKEIFDPVHNGNLKKYYHGQMDLFYFFFHLALNLGKQDSSVAFITTNYYPTASGARKLRQDFKQRAIIRNLVNFNELKIFEAALGQHNMLTILQKGSNKNIIAKTCITKRRGDSNSEILQTIVDGTDTRTDYFKVAQGDLYDGEESYIRLAGNSMESNNPIQSSINKIKQQGVLLSTLCNVNVGLYTGADKVSSNYIQKYLLKMDRNEGIFILTKEEMQALNLNNLEQSKIRSFYKNSDIFRWYTKQTPDLFLIDISYPENKNIDLKKIPNIFKHILKYEKILRNRKSNDNGLRAVIAAGYWWSFTIRQIDFSKPKIVVPQRSSRNTFGYNEIPWYASADVYFITEKDKSFSLKYLLALLNSRLYYLWLYHRGKRKGETLELYQKPLSEIPIKKISKDEQKSFIDLVDKILAITKDDDYLENPAPKAKVREYEKQIDQLVYKLYGLTSEETKIIENMV